MAKMLVKLTDEKDRTHGGMQWGPGVTHGPTNGQGELCGPGWIHYYEGLGVAMLLRNRGDANFRNPHVWRIKSSGTIKRNRLKSGAQSVTTLERLEVTPPTTEQLVTCAVLLALEVVDPIRNAAWVTWAENWLSGEDRSCKSAAAYAAAAYATDDADAAPLDVNGLAEAVFGY